MRASVSDRLLLAFFGALALSSVGLKAAAGPPSDGLTSFRGEVERQLATSLRAQGFTTFVTPPGIQSSIVHAARGACRLSVRDARNGESNATIFAQQAKGIGPVRYLYRGEAYPELPTFAVRVGRLETELLNRTGLHARTHIPVALASSPQCRGADFGLSDVRMG